MNVSEGSGQNVTVRQGEVETIEYTRDKGLSITVHIGHKRGNASSSDFSPQAIRETVSAALSIARYTADDIYAGLADQDLLATSFPDLDLYHPWSLPVEEAIELARQCEAAALATDKRITNSEGASVSAGASHFVYANSLGFCAGYPLSRHSISCAVIAGEQNNMQRDYWYSVARAAGDLEAIEEIGKSRYAQPGTPRRQQNRNLRSAGTVRIDHRLQPDRLFRPGNQWRQPVPEIFLPAGQYWQTGISGNHSDQ